MKYIVTHYICKERQEGVRVTCYNNSCALCGSAKYPSDNDIIIGWNAEIEDLTPQEVYNRINNAQGVVILPYDKSKKYKTNRSL